MQQIVQSEYANSGMRWWAYKFPESLFQCRLGIEKLEYAHYCINGYNIAKNSKVLFLSTARNVESTFLSTVYRLEYLASMFKDYFVFVYENDSTDDTKLLLNDWCNHNKNVGVLRENLNIQHVGSIKSAIRTKYMADARNKYLEFARNFRQHDLFSFDYVIIFDFDLRGGWSYEGIFNSIGHTDDVVNWDMVGSNGLLYRKVCNKSPIRDHVVIERLHFDSWAYREFGKPEETDPVATNLLLYNRGESLVRVNSCFGGLAIYKPRFLDEADVWYTEGDCDHATLNNQLAHRGYNLYLNPSQIVLYSTDRD